MARRKNKRTQTRRPRRRFGIKLFDLGMLAIPVVNTIGRYRESKDIADALEWGMLAPYTGISYTSNKKFYLGRMWVGLFPTLILAGAKKLLNKLAHSPRIGFLSIW